MKCTIFKTFVNFKFILQYLNYNIHVLLLVQIPFLEFISYNVPTSYYFIPNSQHCATVIFVQYIICKPQFCIYYLVKVPNMFELSTVTSKINYSWPSNLYTIGIAAMLGDYISWPHNFFSGTGNFNAWDNCVKDFMTCETLPICQIVHTVSLWNWIYI